LLPGGGFEMLLLVVAKAKVRGLIRLEFKARLSADE
jgi:hypothetical protein